MRPFVRPFLPVFAAAILFAAGARAESIFPVNEIVGNNRVFDQPSVAANGNTIHVAFVGTNPGDTDNTLYYAAVNGAADFTSAATTRSQVIVTPAVAIGNGLYAQARHPQIAVRSSNQVVILFQAIPAGGTESKLFRALVSLENNAVTAQQVNEVRDPLGNRMAGALIDPSFALVSSDNTARVAYVDNTAGADGTAHVLYARVGLENALLADTPILLTILPASQGVLPLPRLRLDGLNRSHIVWAANNNGGAASGVYYALVKQAATGVDNLAIGATQVLPGGYRWGFPNVLAVANSRILVLAADEPFGPNDGKGIAGSIGISVLNPDGVVQNGLPVNILNVGSNATFFYSPPGQAVLATPFDAYRPEAALDGSNHVYIAGYGSLSGESPLRGTPGRFYAMTVSQVTTTTGAIAGFAETASAPLPVGNGELAFAGTFPGDYTRPAFARFSGKSVLFWSGPEVLSGGRNLYVTSVPSAADPATPTTQSGCSAVDDARRGEAGRIPGAAVLLLPAALLALRKVARKAFAR
ncbi:MAG TPA: hypothetical protein VF847_02360 [Candidatus Deferrimicrobiaceae bacterium]